MAEAGYSGTPLPQKLGIKPESVLALVGAPDDADEVLGALPDGVDVRRRLTPRADVTIWFVLRARDLRRRAARVCEVAGPARLWIAWPKRASGVDTDVTESLVRQTGLDHGVVDYKIAAIDPTWSGLCFTTRK